MESFIRAVITAAQGALSKRLPLNSKPTFPVQELEPATLLLLGQGLPGRRRIKGGRRGKGPAPSCLSSSPQQRFFALARAVLPVAAAGSSFQFFQHLQKQPHDIPLRDDCTSQSMPLCRCLGFWVPTTCTHTPPPGMEGDWSRGFSLTGTPPWSQWAPDLGTC